MLQDPLPVIVIKRGFRDRVAGIVSCSDWDSDCIKRRRLGEVDDVVDPKIRGLFKNIKGEGGKEAATGAGAPLQHDGIIELAERRLTERSCETGGKTLLVALVLAHLEQCSRRLKTDMSLLAPHCVEATGEAFSLLYTLLKAYPLGGDVADAGATIGPEGTPPPDADGVTTGPEGTPPPDADGVTIGPEGTPPPDADDASLADYVPLALIRLLTINLRQVATATTPHSPDYQSTCASSGFQLHGERQVMSCDMHVSLCILLPLASKFF